MFKPFKPPQLKKAAETVSIDLTSIPDTDVIEDSCSDDDVSRRPYKKRKLLVHDPVDYRKEKASTISKAASAPRKPLLAVKNPTETKHDEGADSPESYYQVLWRKYTNKKHKTWDGDGVLSVFGGYARLQDVSGREMGRALYKDPLLPGSTLSVGGKDIEIDSVISKEDFLAGRPFLKGGVSQKSSSEIKVVSSPSNTGPKLLTPKVKLKPAKKDEGEEIVIPAKSFYGTTTLKSDAMKSHYKNPLLSSTIIPQNKDGSPTPRHDPSAPNALVMTRPKDCPKGKQIVDVVVDPFLGKHLRKHQREGVSFLYECVMGMRDFNGQGALLADEMGLGKTLQTIALIWTLLKQNPIYGTEGVIKKALIVCPVTLINNWKKEFNKWLGNERIGVLVANGDKQIRLTDFTHGKSYSVMIIGYEKLRTVQDELKKGGGIDIVIADEGHRLKTAQNKSAQAIRALNTDRRVILSGTPLQNDLSEFFIMVDFINPGLLGTWNTFKKEFEAPILKSKEPGSSKRDIEKGNARGEELNDITKQFILRRTSEILSEFLPPKTEYILFCRPTQAQEQVYQHIIGSPAFDRAIGSKGGSGTEASLQLITILKKVCNSPTLLLKEDAAASTNANVAQLLEIIPTELLKKRPALSSVKFRVLNRMLKALSTETSEKIVIVSNYTATLNLIGQHLTTMSLPFLRLDGSTPTTKRQDLVDAFNRTPATKNFAFLLSAKSGGAGINLIGASRLVLFDVDWNPATDLQAMARIHRDGQKRPVKIYRFLMAGGMDEKIYQRQVSKMGLADSVVDGKKTEASFSADELRDLFRLDLKDGCQTHDLLGCECKGMGVHPVAEPRLESIEPMNTIDDSDTDDDFPLVPATTANIAAIEKRTREKREKALKSKGKMQALMRYAHVNTDVFLDGAKDVFGEQADEEMTRMEGVLDDAVLVEVLKDERCKVGYVFAKKG